MEAFSIHKRNKKLMQVLPEIAKKKCMKKTSEKMILLLLASFDGKA